ncbi:MAG TPA: peptidoglycan -binding protein [Aestuariivirgaceae bacterium]|jgi:chemotaxis protein MotB|nr:peptidoglycan -binding protein [Aestuariivirgaceae bacterium]
MASIATRRSRVGEPGYYWPGFVDAMAQLLLVITFLLSVFIIAQFLVARQMAGQDTALAKLRSQMAELADLLALEKSAKADLELALGTLSDDFAASKEENARLSTLLADETKEGAAASTTVSGLQSAVDKEKKISAEALSQVEILNQQLAALRRQLAALNAALEAAESKDRESQTQIADLGKRLNSALAQKVQELARYRSEFFGRLRQILSQRSDIRVVGDRFVFQSEVLFPKGSAQINELGLNEMRKLAIALRELEQEIPSDLAWVLRVDGHTDVDPITTATFRSNWDLSSARAISVVNVLIENGVQPQHLVAAGFGEFQPIDAATTEEAKSRNRRIELKLTER